VATFIGSPAMNLYEAGLEAAGTLVLGSQRLELPADVAARTAAGARSPSASGPKI